jgi:hypothetical protein
MSIKKWIHLSFSALVLSICTNVLAEEGESSPPPTKPANEKPSSDDKGGTPLDTNLQTNVKDDTIPGVFRDMVVVQRRAKKKAGHFLFSTYPTIDFSDGPITSYAINTNPGYAFSDSFELYANFVPFFITNERPIVKKVREIGPGLDITYAKPKMQYGVEALWLPAYGKESWGAFSIVRSDTFLKFGAATQSFEGGTSGLRFNGMVGKTYFLGNWFNIRVAAGIAYVQSIVEGEKKSNWVPVIESGLVFYF